MYKPHTIEQYKVYRFLEENFALEHLNNFPQKVYWPRLAEVLESNGLAAEVTAQGIQVSW